MQTLPDRSIMGYQSEVASEYQKDTRRDASRDHASENRIVTIIKYKLSLHHHLPEMGDRALHLDGLCDAGEGC